MFKVLSVLAALVALAPGAQAATLNFLTTINGGFPAYDWDQSSAPVPISYATGGFDAYTAVPVTPVDTDQFPGGYDSIAFFAAPHGMFGSFAGDQLYSGSEAHPIFLPGVYNGTDFLGDNIQVFVTTVSTVPEPGTWALMIIGLGGAGAALRARRRAFARALP